MSTGPFTIPTVDVSAASRGQVRFNVPGALGLLYNIVNVRTYPGVLEQAQQEQPEISYAGIQVIEEEEAELSPIGTPIMYPIVFKAGSYKQHDKDGKVQEVQMDTLRLPVTTIVEMSRAKSITKTPVVASQASVKEVFALDDWSIRLSGILFDEPNHPQGARTIEVMQERLLQWYNLADSIELEGRLFTDRGVHRLALKSFSINQMPGKKRVFGYQMEAESDDPIELIIQ